MPLLCAINRLATPVANQPDAAPTTSAATAIMVVLVFILRFFLLSLLPFVA